MMAGLVAGLGEWCVSAFERVVSAVGRKGVQTTAAAVLVTALGFSGPKETAITAVVSLLAIFTGGNASEWWARRKAGPGNASPPAAGGTAPTPPPSVAGADLP